MRRLGTTFVDHEALTFVDHEALTFVDHEALPHIILHCQLVVGSSLHGIIIDCIAQTLLNALKQPMASGLGAQRFELFINRNPDTNSDPGAQRS